MSDRRRFFKIGLGAAFASVLGPTTLFSQEKKVIPSFGKRRKDFPIVVSTWNHGVEANLAAWKVLEEGGSAMDAAEKGVMVTEADVANKSVGNGGLPDAQGKVTLDACIMNEKSQCGAVAFVQDYEHPISIARSVMENTPHVMLVGEGAEEFAKEQGFDKKKLLSKSSKEDYKAWKKSESQKKPEINSENHDTIGMLVMDKKGNFSGACTTSGWAYKKHGRVGDSPIIGAGLFVDNEVGCACATGLGEAVIRIAGSHTVVELMRSGHGPEEACKMAVERIIAKHDNLEGLQVGFIAISIDGRVGGYSVYNGFNFAYTDKNKALLVDAKSNRNW